MATSGTAALGVFLGVVSSSQIFEPHLLVGRHLPPQLGNFSVGILCSFQCCTDSYTLKCICVLFELQTFIARHRTRLRGSPRSYGQLDIHVKQLLFQLQTFITRHRTRLRSSPRSYGQLHITVHRRFV